MKVILNNSTLVFKKSMQELTPIEFVGVQGTSASGISQSTATRICYVYDVRNINTIIVDGLKVRNSLMGYFYDGTVPTEETVFPNTQPEILETWKASHSCISSIPSSEYGYVSDDIVENAEIPVPQGATTYIAWVRISGSYDNVHTYVKE